MMELFSLVGQLTLSGMLGIFAVLAMIMLCVIALNKFSEKSGKGKE